MFCLAEVRPFIVVHQRAVEVMCFVPKRCNDMMNVGRLQGFEVSYIKKNNLKQLILNVIM